MTASRHEKSRAAKRWLCLVWMATLSMEIKYEQFYEHALYDFLRGCIYIEPIVKCIGCLCDVGCSLDVNLMQVNVGLRKWCGGG